MPTGGCSCLLVQPKANVQFANGASRGASLLSGYLLQVLGHAMPMRCSVKCISKAKTSKAAPVALPTLQSGLKHQVSPTCSECVSSLTCMLPFRWPSTPNKQRTAKLQPNPRAHSKVHCAAECHLNACCAQHVTAWQGSGHCPGSSAPAAAAFVPTAATKVPQVDSSQTTAQVRCYPTPLLPALQSLSQVAVTLFDGKRERLTLNASFSGALLLPFHLSSNVLIARCFRCSTPRPLFRSPRLVCMCFQIYPWNCVHTLCWCSTAASE